jgi:hydroxymethylpyrimidine/phosphomethylpyrimidine kinase
MIPPKILIVAGSDSGGGAGIQADIKTVTMFGGHAMTAITALTAQNTLGVDAVMPVTAAFVLQQMETVLSDLGADAVKIGMIGSAGVAEAVAARLEALDGVPVVFDPVMVATSGSVLADEATIAAFERLMAVARVVTPNAPELAALTGRDPASLTDLDEVEDAALALAKRTGIAVLAKGGHVQTRLVTDVLVEADGSVVRWESPRIETTNTHGTGCTLASGIACGLAQGRSIKDAVTRAREYVQAAIAAAPGFGSGHGPLAHAVGTVPFHLTVEGKR